MTPLKPTPAEQKLLETILREVRHARSTGDQLSIVVDHWVSGDGVNVAFTFCGVGWSGELAGNFRSQAKRSRRPSRKGGAK